MRGWPFVTSIALVEWLRRHRSPAADLQKQFDQQSRELTEARKQLAEAVEQQSAISEVLQVISSCALHGIWSLLFFRPYWRARCASARPNFGNLFLL